jgi:hypothetical protein
LSENKLIVPVSQNRLEGNLCLYCGDDLLGESEMGMHVKCRKKVEEAVRKQVANRKEREGKVKQFKIKAPEGLVNKKP